MQMEQRAKGAIAVLTALLAASAAAAETVDTTVVIIGGGAAGIAAATELQAHQVDFVLLEARDVLGGRVRTSTFAGFPFSEGAAWIHGKEAGGEANPIYVMANQQNVAWAATNWEDATYRSRSTGQQLPTNLVQAWNERVQAASSHCSAKNAELWTQAAGLAMPESIDVTVASCWEEFDFFNPPQSNDVFSSAESPAMAQLLQWYAVDFDNIGRPQELGVMASGPSQGSEESYYYYYTETVDHFVMGSYYEILRSAGSGLPAGSVKMGQYVTTVDYSDSAVLVTTAQGLIVNASVLICTLPLGVLQRRVVTWNPPFSAEKLSAIDGTVMGSYAKAILEFPSVFWDSSEWSYITGSYESGRVKVILNRDNSKLNSGSKVIEMRFTGAQAVAIESGTVPEAQALIMAELRTVYGASIPDPTSILLTNWTHDPYSYGSYMVWPFGYTRQEWELMKASINDVIFFAGEHLAQNSGYVHTAWETGKTVVRSSVLPALGISVAASNAHMAVSFPGVLCVPCIVSIACSLSVRRAC
mmetsp:Transcript_37085/g.86894  ORF Transcript_37085/g.86894 Transcript_37085/m.86894 type:complete len:529 (-) Transcript_37085:247-1833(-)